MIDDSIQRSISHTEIVTVRTTDPDAVLAEAKKAAADAGLECDWTDVGEHIDVWAYSADAPEGEMVWRLYVT